MRFVVTKAKSIYEFALLSLDVLVVGVPVYINSISSWELLQNFIKSFACGVSL